MQTIARRTINSVRWRCAGMQLIPFTDKARNPDWNKAVSDAEKVVGYPTSFLSLRALLSDELSNVALQMRKLVGTKHPLLKTARKFLYGGKHSLQTRGLLVLLLSKAAGQRYQSDNPTTDGLLPSQRNLAEITEMIHTAHLIHKGVVNLDRIGPNDGMLADMEFGNKMAVLSGDFLLANASTGLADLNSTKTVELMSRAIADLTEAEFSDLRDVDGNAVLPEPVPTFHDWKKQTFLSSGSLLANACRSSMILADLPDTEQERAFMFGENIAYAHQIRDEIQLFTNSSDDNGNCVALSSLPVILACQQESCAGFVRTASHRQIVEYIKTVDVLSTCGHYCQKFGQAALDSLQILPASEAKQALENIIHAVISR